jgi:hypothetical protein
MAILKSSDSTKTAIEKMARISRSGDVDKAAECVLGLLVRDADKFDPEENSSEIRHLHLLDRFKIYGRDIYTLYDRQCGGDISLLILLLRITELGIYSSTGLKSLAAKPNGVSAFKESIWRTHIADIKSHRPRYKSSYAVLGSKNYWAYLYFRALWLNEDYKAYCHVKRISDFKKQKLLRKKYPRLDRTYSYWGDIFGNPEHRSELVGFDFWVKENVYKLEHISFERIELLNVGESFAADAGTVYLTIPKTASKKYVRSKIKERANLLSKALDEIDLVSELGIGAADRGEYKSLYPTERRLDVYYWRIVQEIPYKKIVEKLYRSDRSAWEKFAISIEKTLVDSGMGIDRLQDVDLKTQTEALRKILPKGKNLVKNVLLKEFPLIS